MSLLKTLIAAALLAGMGLHAWAAEKTADTAGAAAEAAPKMVNPMREKEPMPGEMKRDGMMKEDVRKQAMKKDAMMQDAMKKEQTQMKK
jgi:hypothetical protein